MKVAITGGSGSLGSAIIRRLVKAGEADRIVTFTRDEAKRSAMQRTYADAPHVKVYAGDVRDYERMLDIFSGCDLVIHAAARKVVSGFPDEPREMLLTNVEGTRNVMAAARAAGVSKVLFVSSDKAVRPENVYGVSKAMAEHLVIAENARSVPQGCAMSVIRYGNVIASRGSVVQVWREALERGERLKISDRRMTRFWLTVDEAVSFVLSAARQMTGGEVFVPKIGCAPVVNLAQAVAGRPDVELVNMGIRPGGEKLHEELVSADEARRTVSVDVFFYVVLPTEGDWMRPTWTEAERVPDDFTYRSDTWYDRLSHDVLVRMVTP